MNEKDLYKYFFNKMFLKLLYESDLSSLELLWAMILLLESISIDLNKQHK